MITASLQAQQLKGVIVNKKGKPVPNLTVYIYEIAKGIVADNRVRKNYAGHRENEPGSFTSFRSKVKLSAMEFYGKAA